MNIGYCPHPTEENRSPVGRPVFKTGEGRETSLVGSTPTLFRQSLRMSVPEPGVDVELELHTTIKE